MQSIKVDLYSASHRFKSVIRAQDHRGIISRAINFCAILLFLYLKVK